MADLNECEICHHALTQRTHRCLYCLDKKLCGCSKCFKKSLANTPLIKYWLYEKNTVNPALVRPDSSGYCWFKCNVCGSPTYIRINHFAQRKRCKCAFKSPRKVANIEQYYLPKNNIPFKLIKHGEYYYWFKCKSCSHEIFTKLSNFIISSKCKFCSNQELCGCSQCTRRSLANSASIHFWCFDLNKTNPIYVPYRNTRIHYWFRCRTCGQYVYRTPRSFSDHYKCQCKKIDLMLSS